MHITTARRIVANPADHPPQLRRLAWCALKTARGQTVRQSRLWPGVAEADTGPEAA